MNPKKTRARTLLSLVATLALVACQATITPSPTAAIRPTDSPAPTVTPVLAATSDLTPIVLALTETYSSKLYPISVAYPATWKVSEDKWQGQDHSTTITLAPADTTGQLTEAIYVLAQVDPSSANDAELIGVTDEFGESWLGQPASRQTERSHIITLNGKRFAIADYFDANAANAISMMVATHVGHGSVVVAWGSYPPENHALFHETFEALISSVTLK